jgi:hypothetical protein
MERGCEEAQTEESPRRGARPLGRPGAQRGQEARQQEERPQGRPGEKPQEDPRRQAQRAPATTRAPQVRVSAAISSIQARFGQCAIGLGYLGIRYDRSKTRVIPVASDAAAAGTSKRDPGLFIEGAST